MIDLYRCSIKQLEEYLAIEQARLDANPLDAVANARWKNLISMIKRKHVEEMCDTKQK